MQRKTGLTVLAAASILAIPALSVTTLTGCAKTKIWINEKLGHEKREQLVSSVENARDQQEKAKVVEKKRNAVLKKKKKEKKAPAPEVEVPAPEPEAPKPPPPPETAVALLRRLARAIQQLGDERSETRKQGLETIARVVDAPLPEATRMQLQRELARLGAPPPTPPPAAPPSVPLPRVVD